MPQKYISNSKYTTQHRIERSQTTKCIQYNIHDTMSCELPKYLFLTELSDVTDIWIFYTISTLLNNHYVLKLFNFYEINFNNIRYAFLKAAEFNVSFISIQSLMFCRLLNCNLLWFYLKASILTECYSNTRGNCSILRCLSLIWCNSNQFSELL